MTPKTLTHDDIPATYAELVALHMPRPLHDEADYRNATGALDAMAGFEKVPAASVAHVFHSIMILFIL